MQESQSQCDSCFLGQVNSDYQDSYPESIGCVTLELYELSLSPCLKHQFVVSIAIAGVGEYFGIMLQTKRGCVLL